MRADAWPEVEKLFNRVVNLAPPQRDSLLATVDVTVRGEVERLLANHSRTNTSILDLVKGAMDSLTPQRLGPYRVTGIAGQGGMGAVFRAVRDDSAFEKQVAIKVMHLGLDAARFRQERGILAGLEHPNIARLLDGGETESGVSYIVMEYVEGLPLLTYCDQNQLSREARLRLFLQVCTAVQYAHQNLIVHRDLKPSNVLVTAEGVPKLLDFGVAKLLGADAERTATMFQALTPQYASPEQVMGQAITTASDVYSLGIVLYELLSGRRPYDFPDFSASTVSRTICETQPVAPHISEDLDNILLMALRKEPSRRYLAVQQLAEDIERSLTDRPVLARPDTIHYRTRKFIRRNRLSVMAAALALTGVVAGSAVAIYQGRLAQQRFQDVRKLAHTFVFDLHDEVAKLPGSTHVRQMMVSTGLEYLDSLARNAGGDLGLQREIADAYIKIGNVEGFPTDSNLGRTQDAVASYRKAGEIYRHIAQRNVAYLPDLAHYYMEFGALVRFASDLPQARRLSLDAIQTMDRVRAGPNSNAIPEGEYSRAWCTLGDMDEDMGQYNQAWVDFRRCDEVAVGMLARKRDYESLFAAQGAAERMATAAQETGRLSESLKALDEDEVLIRELLTLRPGEPRLKRREMLLYAIRSETYKNDLAADFGDPTRALIYGQQYMEAAKRLADADPRDTSSRRSYAIALFQHAYFLRESDSPAAVRAARESVAIFDELIAGGTKDYLVVSRRARALRRLSQALLKAGQARESRVAAESALADQRGISASAPAMSEERMIFAGTLIAAAEAYAVEGNFPRAESMLAEARETATQIAQGEAVANRLPLALVEESFGALKVRMHQKIEARASYQKIVDIWGHFPGNEYAERQKAAAEKLVAAIQ